MSILRVKRCLICGKLYLKKIIERHPPPIKLTKYENVKKYLIFSTEIELFVKCKYRVNATPKLSR